MHQLVSRAGELAGAAETASEAATKASKVAEKSADTAVKAAEEAARRAQEIAEAARLASEEAVKKAEKEIIKRHGRIRGLKKRAEMIAYGAIKYSILKVSADKNVYFDMDAALSFEGESAPYIQYAHARACSILEKAKKCCIIY